MSKEFLLCTHLSACGALGRTPKWRGEAAHWDKTIALADEQSVLTLVYCALKACPQLNCPPCVREEVARKAKSAILGQFIRNQQSVDLLGIAARRGLQPLILKGMGIANAYAVPESRLSADVDIYIDAGREKEMQGFLREQGFTVWPREKDFHHAVCFHPQLGVWELHSKLFSRHAQSVWLNGIELGKSISLKPFFVQSPWGGFFTLAPTDHMIYLALHFLNHFVNSGVSLKMCLDFIALLEKSPAQIDVTRVEQAIRRCRGDGLIQCVFGLMKAAAVPTRIALFSHEGEGLHALGAFIRDMESGGTMGHKEELPRRLARNRDTCARIVADKGKAAYLCYRIKYFAGKTREYVFPSYASLAVQSPILSRHPLILPLSYARWLYVNLKAIVARRRALRPIPDRARADILKCMGIIRSGK